MSSFYDAVLLISYGGPEKPDDVIPFLENVVRGRNVPPARLLEVAEHYQLFGGVSPINAHNRALLAALVDDLRAHGLDLPVYWGNRHWHPLLDDTLRQMAEDGVSRALALVTSAFSSNPGCRQYLDHIERARKQLGPKPPQVDKLRVFYNHPGFIGPMAERVQRALEEVPADRRPSAQLLYTAHSIPVAMARRCAYERQLGEACRLVSQQAGRSEWQLVYQSRSGPPSQPWLGPDVNDYVRQMGEAGEVRDVVLVPIGFLCEHMEIVYDLDVATRAVCDAQGVNMVRSAVVGCHPRFVRMIRELIEERIGENPHRLALGDFGPAPDCCPPDCCPTE